VISVKRDTSRNAAKAGVFYSVVAEKPMRRDPLRHQTVDQLLGLLAAAETSRRKETTAASDARLGA
jgi:hypothetical protein